MAPKASKVQADKTKQLAKVKTAPKAAAKALETTTSSEVALEAKKEQQNFAYSDSDPDKKKSLIARYKAEGGIKNLAWVMTYQEESKDQEITDHEVKKGYMYASEILTLNGFVANQFDGKTQEAVVKGLLQDCYQSFGIDPKNPGFDLEQPHPKVPEPNKFWYMKKLLSTTDRSISETKMGLQMDMQSQGLSKALGGSSGADSVVKVENQTYLDLKQEITVVQSMKTSLEKEHHKAQTLWDDLKAEAKPEVNAVLDNMGKVSTLS
eukprot:symbB.v1.2.019373.t1/scaffold1582.1/size178113/8